ncbi:TadA family conjugal transfer-associated ATPase [Tessaracoccus antarcticus]|uniref:TadA family conjugal transfer-associated ATPase n=1 Tax=Tessaracoccus antarcticus TaxID=2479848 RepID=A0A3M0GIC4_9ACTN|nr:TadA family conjugal transfer-associated ATPase [Tessaracoccus antarcticus]RMB62362.1 TadA family conjugal transfer-associated ATPase [Tessaracoccus antarcticus]
MDEKHLQALQSVLGRLARPHTPADVATALRGLGVVVTDHVLLDTMEVLRRHSIGAGPLEDLLRTPGVTDVVVNGTDGVFIDRGRGLERTNVVMFDDEQVRRLAIRLATAAGRRLDDSQPFVDGRLADGTRLHAVLSPVASPGTCISLRIPAPSGLTLQQLMDQGSLAPDAHALLVGMVAQRVPFLISGGTGSGKTTLLAAMLGLVPASERIVVVEDARELAPHHPHCLRLEGRPPNTEGVGGITLTALVRQALRMRPDRIVVGEVRGGELCDLLTALNTGHEGGCGTVHANSVADVPARLEALAALGGLGRDACHAQLASALRVAVHVRRRPDGTRGVAEMGLFTRETDGGVRIEPAVGFSPGGVEWGSGAARLREWAGLS